MKFTTSDNVIDTIVAACDGDIRRALEVLFMLEAEIEKLAAALSRADQEHSSP
jgi:replication-associated recombination protein RarA